ncbi:uncharacterized protein [Spinacia oleracea]|uniref:Uncharacterized protein LOC110798220 isoform X1 n=1 Tax=Spinacia oleracea TaxID=3562 RepID=A0A9R0J365_SPIOL|nr:uncharacterized protein LOC110798220 isoform X1 [Spinacia oleracea]XP_021859085.1 uncharacterized protein LOC110798220 isoform X1 [Spinacia oleracea]
MANGSKSRLHNRAITISSRSKRVARRSSQGRETQNNNNQVVRTEPDNNVELGNNGQLGNNTQSTTDLQDEELDGNNDIEQPSKKSAWKKRPRTFDWKLTAAAPGGPLSTELLRGYCGHVACDIWENNNERGCLVIQSRTQALDLFEFDATNAWCLLVKSTGLSHLRNCVFPHHNSPLISAFVERWHPETNSFHLPFGEMTTNIALL